MFEYLSDFQQLLKTRGIKVCTIRRAKGVWEVAVVRGRRHFTGRGRTLMGAVERLHEALEFPMVKAAQRKHGE